MRAHATCLRVVAHLRTRRVLACVSAPFQNALHVLAGQPAARPAFPPAGCPARAAHGPPAAAAVPHQRHRQQKCSRRAMCRRVPPVLRRRRRSLPSPPPPPGPAPQCACTQQGSSLTGGFSGVVLQPQAQPGRKPKRRKIDPMTPPPPASEFPAWQPREFFHFEVLHTCARSAPAQGGSQAGQECLR